MVRWATDEAVALAEDETAASLAARVPTKESLLNAMPLHRSALSPSVVHNAQLLGMSLYHCQVLAYNLRAAAEMMVGSHPGDAAIEHLDAYLRLQWLARVDGRWVLTPSGQSVCDRTAWRGVA